jgi:hypothetical protein
VTQPSFSTAVPLSEVTVSVGCAATVKMVDAASQVSSSIARIGRARSSSGRAHARAPARGARYVYVRMYRT